MAIMMVGKQAPAFTCTAVVDGRLKEVSLSSYTDANHWVILVFFPKAWSFICPTEIRAFSARLEEFLYARSCAVLFASTDSDHSLKAWNATSELEGGLGGVHVPLVSDCSHKLSLAYRVLIEDEGVAQRALFIIDPRGVIRNITVNDADVGRSVDESLRILDALIFKDEFGEGCPVDWKKGDKGIDVASKNRIEGAIEVKDKRHTWSEWARPKLSRGWSNASQRSFTSVMPSLTSAAASIQTAPPMHLNAVHTRHRSSSNLASGVPSTLPSGQQSPAIPMSPTSHMLGSQASAVVAARLEEGAEEALAGPQVDNYNASASNARLTSVGTIGLAN